MKNNNRYLSGEERADIARRNLRKAKGKETGPKNTTFTRLNGWKTGAHSTSIIAPCISSCEQQAECRYLKARNGKFTGPCSRMQEEYNTISAALHDAYKTGDFTAYKEYVTMLIAKYGMVADAILGKILRAGIADRTEECDLDLNANFAEQQKVNWDKTHLAEGRQYVEKLPKIIKETQELPSAGDAKTDELVDIGDDMIAELADIMLKDGDDAGQPGS